MIAKEFEEFDLSDCNEELDSFPNENYAILESDNYVNFINTNDTQTSKFQNDYKFLESNQNELNTVFVIYLCI